MAGSVRRPERRPKRRRDAVRGDGADRDRRAGRQAGGGRPERDSADNPIAGFQVKECRMRQSAEHTNPLTEFHLFDSAYLRIAYGRLFQSKYWVTVQKRFGLSNREIQVGILMVKGLENEEIADSLGIGAGTVRTHIKAIKLKLVVSTRSQTVVKLILATGILTEDIN